VKGFQFNKEEVNNKAVFEQEWLKRGLCFSPAPSDTFLRGLFAGSLLLNGTSSGNSPTLRLWNFLISLRHCLLSKIIYVLWSIMCSIHHFLMSSGLHRMKWRHWMLSINTSKTLQTSKLVPSVPFSGGILQMVAFKQYNVTCTYPGFYLPWFKFV